MIAAISVHEGFRGLARFGDDQFRGEAALIERLLGHQTDDFRVVVVLAEMAQDDGAGAGIERLAQEAAGDLIRQMAVAAHDALLHGPRVGADLQHFEIVIGFEQQHIGTLQVHADGFGEVAEVGGDGHFDAFGTQAETDGVDCVVRDGEAVDLNVADGETGTSLEEFEVGLVFTPGNGRGGQAGAIDRDVQFLGDGGEAADVVAVFVGDQDGGDRFRLNADRGEALEGFLAAKPGVDEDAGPRGGDQRGIAGAG